MNVYFDPVLGMLRTRDEAGGEPSVPAEPYGDELHFWPLQKDFKDIIGGLDLIPNGGPSYFFNGGKCEVTARGEDIYAAEPILAPLATGSFSFCGFARNNLRVWNAVRVGEGRLSGGGNMETATSGVAFGIDGDNASINNDNHWLDGSGGYMGGLQFFAVIQDAAAGRVYLVGPDGSLASAASKAKPVWNFSGANRNFGLLEAGEYKSIRLFNRALTQTDLTAILQLG